MVATASTTPARSLPDPQTLRTRELAGAARENQLDLDQLQGGTFTVTTLGALGST